MVFIIIMRAFLRICGCALHGTKTIEKLVLHCYKSFSPATDWNNIDCIVGSVCCSTLLLPILMKIMRLVSFFINGWGIPIELLKIYEVYVVMCAIVFNTKNMLYQIGFANWLPSKTITAKNMTKNWKHTRTCRKLPKHSLIFAKTWW